MKQLVALVSRVNSVCAGIGWSSQPRWNASPTLFVDGSLLAVGSRAGFVTFLRRALSLIQLGLCPD